MYSQPRINNINQIYKLNKTFRRNLAILYVIFLFLTPFAVYGFMINEPNSHLLVILFVILFIVLYTWVSFHMLFVYRLELDQQGGSLYLLGKTISFTWDQADQLAYVYVPQDKSAQLYLYLHQISVKKSKFFPAIRNFPLPVLSDKMIPLDKLYTYEPFIIRGLNRKPPTAKEIEMHFRHFLGTVMGQHLMKYAPHVIAPVMHHYLTDDNMPIV